MFILLMILGVLTPKVGARRYRRVLKHKNRKVGRTILSTKAILAVEEEEQIQTGTVVAKISKIKTKKRGVKNTSKADGLALRKGHLLALRANKKAVKVANIEKDKQRPVKISVYQRSAAIDAANLKWANKAHFNEVVEAAFAASSPVAIVHRGLRSEGARIAAFKALDQRELACVKARAMNFKMAVTS